MLGLPRRRPAEVADAHNSGCSPQPPRGIRDFMRKLFAPAPFSLSYAQPGDGTARGCWSAKHPEPWSPECEARDGQPHHEGHRNECDVTEHESGDREAAS